MANPKILVSGATGKIGKQVVRYDKVIDVLRLPENQLRKVK